MAYVIKVAPSSIHVKSTRPHSESGQPLCRSNQAPREYIVAISEGNEQANSANHSDFCSFCNSLVVICEPVMQLGLIYKWA